MSNKEHSFWFALLDPEKAKKLLLSDSSHFKIKRRNQYDWVALPIKKKTKRS